MTVLQKLQSILINAFQNIETDIPKPVEIGATLLPYTFTSQNPDKESWEMEKGELRLNSNNNYEILDISGEEKAKKHFGENASLLKVETPQGGNDIFAIDMPRNILEQTIADGRPIQAVIPPQGGLTILPESTHNFIFSKVKTKTNPELAF